MKRWLALVGLLPVAAAAPADAQMKGISPGEVASVARTRSLDLRLSPEIGVPRPAPLIRGMLVQRELTPNAIVGIGLANIYSKRRAGSDLSSGERPNRSRKPAITFALKF